MALTPVDMIIKELCRETGEPEYRNYDAFVGHIRRGFAQINIAAVQVVKHAYLELNNYNAIDWPCDCIKPLMVGLNRNGCVVTLSLDESIMPLNANDSCTTVTEAEDCINSITNGSNVPDYTFSVNGNGELYGLGPGFNTSGYVSHDRAGRQTHFKGCIQEDDSYLFVYLSDGISEGIDFVPVETENALRAFALSEYYRIKNPNVSQVETQRYRQEVTFLRNFYQASTADEWREVFRHNEKSSPK